MALDFANAGQLPKAPAQYSPEFFNQFARVLEVYFSQLDSQMWNHAERYTAKQFVALDGAFYGGRFFGDGSFLRHDEQRFASIARQVSAPLGTANVIEPVIVGAFTSSITLVPPSRITFAVPGLYDFSYYLQFGNAAPGPQVVSVWMRLNGADIANTAVKVMLGPGYPGLVSFLYAPIVSAGDYIELVWAATDTAVTLESYPATAASPGVAPAIPATHSVAISVVLREAPIPADAVLRLPHRLRNV